jgi:hypothetical protein
MKSAGPVCNVVLEEFLRSGKLGSLHLGSSRSEVRRLLGEPPDRSEQSWQNEIWKYHGVEIAFRSDSLSFIGLYFEDGEVVLPQALLETGKLTIENERVEDVEGFLRARRIDFTVENDLTFDDYRVLRITESHVGIGFVEDHLRSMQLIARDGNY